MSDVLQLSGAPGWATVDNSANPDRQAGVSARTLESNRDGHSEAAGTRDKTEGNEGPATAAVAEKLGRPRSAATPYLQYLTTLVQRIFLTQDRVGVSIRSVVFAGVDTRRDSALLPAAVAELLASRVSGRVCLVDADVLNPSLHDCYGVSNDIGLRDALRGTGPVRSYARRLIQGHESSLWLLPSGSSRADGELLLTSDEEQTRMRDLMASFDYVVIAAPSLTDHPAATAIGAQVDGIVLIVKAHVTRRRAVRACAASLQSAGGKVLGTVLSNRTFPIPEAIYRLL